MADLRCVDDADNVAELAKSIGVEWLPVEPIPSATAEQCIFAVLRSRLYLAYDRLLDMDASPVQMFEAIGIRADRRAEWADVIDGMWGRDTYDRLIELAMSRVRRV